MLEIIRSGFVYENRDFHTGFHMIRKIGILEMFMDVFRRVIKDSYDSSEWWGVMAYGNVFHLYTNKQIITIFYYGC